MIRILAQLKPKVDKAILSKANAEKIQTWLDGDPNWLDEIANLSTKAPGGKEFWVIKLNTPKANDGTASMQVLADVKSSDVGERFTNVMRDERHVVRPKTSDEENKVAEYPVNIETEIQISPPKPAAAPKKDSAPAGATAAKQTAPDASDTAKTTTPRRREMKSREKMLAIAVGAVVVLFGLKWGYDLVADMFQSREAAITDRTSREEKDEGTVRAGDLAEKRMKVWQARSLPTNTEKGRADYQHWLTSVADKHLKNASVTRENTISDQGAKPRGGVAAGKDKDKPLDERYRFHIKAVDSDLKMTGVVKFLYDFYTANHLQTIRNLSLTPDKDKLVVSIDVEGMMLPAAERKDVMLKDPLSQLAKGDFSAYENLINKRDLFVKGGYVAPSAPRPRDPGPPSTPPFDIAKYTKVTAIKSYNDEPEIDVTGPAGHHSGLKQGADFKVGDSTYKVLEIGAYDAVLLVDGKDRKHIKLGDVLR